MVYLDNSATTAVCPEAAEKAAWMMTSCFGNPSSLHTVGFLAEQEITLARRRLAEWLGVKPSELIFTSGGTESNNLALFGAAEAKKRAGKHIVTTAVEHSSVMATVAALEQQGFEVTRLIPDTTGMITPEQVWAACRPDTILVSIMLVNNETGARFPVERIIPGVRRISPSALFHCDAVQAAGKLALNLSRLGADLVSVSGHKLHAPKGVGLLYIRKGARILPRAYGGGQEHGLRSGTESTPLIAAMAAAVEALPSPAAQQTHFQELRDRLLDGLSDREDIHIHQPTEAVPYLVHLSVPGIRSETMLHHLAEQEIYVSSGSACSKGQKSPVLTAMGLSDREIDSAIRVSFCHQTTLDDIDRFVAALKAATTLLVRR